MKMDEIMTGQRDTIELDKADLVKLYNKEHTWHSSLVNKFNLPSSSELPSLPQPFMLGFDRAKLVFGEGTGKYGKGYAEAELDVSHNDSWFWCHFLGDPVMPGSIGLDAFLQLTGTWSFFSASIYGRAEHSMARMHIMAKFFLSVKRYITEWM